MAVSNVKFVLYLESMKIAIVAGALSPITVPGATNHPLIFLASIGEPMGLSEMSSIANSSHKLTTLMPIFKLFWSLFVRNLVEIFCQSYVPLGILRV